MATKGTQYHEKGSHAWRGEGRNRKMLKNRPPRRLWFGKNVVAFGARGENRLCSRARREHINFERPKKPIYVVQRKATTPASSARFAARVSISLPTLSLSLSLSLMQSTHSRTRTMGTVQAHSIAGRFEAASVCLCALSERVSETFWPPCVLSLLAPGAATESLALLLGMQHCSCSCWERSCWLGKMASTSCPLWSASPAFFTAGAGRPAASPRCSGSIRHRTGLCWACLHACRPI